MNKQSNRQQNDDLKAIALSSVIQSMTQSQAMFQKFLSGEGPSNIPNSQPSRNNMQNPFRLEEWLQEVLGNIADLQDVVNTFKDAEYDTFDAVRNLSEKDMDAIEAKSLPSTFNAARRKKIMSASSRM